MGMPTFQSPIVLEKATQILRTQHCLQLSNLVLSILDEAKYIYLPKSCLLFSIEFRINIGFIQHGHFSTFLRIHFGQICHGMLKSVTSSLVHGLLCFHSSLHHHVVNFQCL